MTPEERDAAEDFYADPANYTYDVCPICGDSYDKDGCSLCPDCRAEIEADYFDRLHGVTNDDEDLGACFDVMEAQSYE